MNRVFSRQSSRLSDAFSHVGLAGHSAHMRIHCASGIGYVFPRAFAAALAVWLATQAEQRSALPLALCQYSCVVDSAVQDEDVGAGS